jgi:hypothetical protein
MILVSLLLVFVVLLAWRAVTMHREHAKRRALLHAALQYKPMTTVKGALLERKGPNVIPLLQPTERRCPICRTYHVLHPAIIDDRCAACLTDTFDEAPINPGGGWGGA